MRTWKMKDTKCKKDETYDETYFFCKGTLARMEVRVGTRPGPTTTPTSATVLPGLPATAASSTKTTAGTPHASTGSASTVSRLSLASATQDTQGNTARRESGN